MTEDLAARTGEPAMRLFLAVEVPEAVVEAVASAIERWRAVLPNVRWVPPENWHITLKFLGATAAEQGPWLKETVRNVVSTHRHVTVDLRGLGAFPSVERARVLWAGVNDPSSGLAALASDLDVGLAPVFRKEARRFHPHLTVARSEPPVRLPMDYASTSLTTQSFSVEEVVLYRSHLTDGATSYERLRAFALRG